jgi:Peptidase family S41
MAAPGRDAAAAQRGRSLTEALAPEAGTTGAVSAALDGGQRQEILDTLIAVLGGAYAHLPAKRAAYAVDPVQALILLRRRAADLSDADFHLAVTGLVTGLRDGHTRYIGPSALRGRVAVLPFLVEQYGPAENPQFLVTKTAPDLAAIDPAFAPGVVIEWWNGVPMARAVEVYADRETGGRRDSRRARALETLTFRALDYGPPPDEHRVDLGYRTARGTRRELRLPWRVLEPRQAATAVRAGSRASLKVAADPAAEAVRRAKKLLYAPDAWVAEPVTDSQLKAAAPARAAAGEKAPVGQWLDTPMQDVLAAQALRRGIGYLRVWSFDVEDDDLFVTEVTRLVGLLPQTGLIVDLRGNPGGLVWAAERMLQLFTDTRIAPTRFSLVASPLTREMANSPFNRLELEAWAPSLDDAVATGDQYAQPLPLTDPAWCNDIGRRYPGRAVAVVDANTYSSGDLFAAGWVDHDIGPLVTVGQATGGGGANIWTAAQLRDALAGTDHALGALPDGVGYTLAIRRAIRSSLSDGVPIEDLGVSGVPYEMTRADLLHGNRDLLAFCTDLLTNA